MKSQKQLIRAVLESGASRTPLEALDRFKCFRLADVIYKLRRDGLPIETEDVQTADGRTYARYELDKDAPGPMPSGGGRCPPGKPWTPDPPKCGATFLAKTCALNLCHAGQHDDGTGYKWDGTGAAEAAAEFNGHFAGQTAFVDVAAMASSLTGKTITVDGRAVFINKAEAQYPLTAWPRLTIHGVIKDAGGRCPEPSLPGFPCRVVAGMVGTKNGVLTEVDGIMLNGLRGRLQNALADVRAAQELANTGGNPAAMDGRIEWAKNRIENLLKGLPA